MSRLERGLQTVRERLGDADSDRDAVAFVHAASDADAAYLGCAAVVVTPDRAVGLVERGSDTHPVASERLTVRTVEDPPGAVARVLDELTAETGTVLTPRGVRHDVALFLERAGYDLASTTALDDARVVKTPAERARVRRLGAATTTGFDTAVEGLAAATVDDGLLWRSKNEQGANTEQTDESAVLTADDLSREVAATLARRGVDTPGVRVQSVDADEGTLPAGRPVVVECRPVTVDGTRLRAAWTLVVDGDGGWERRAQLALDAAHRAGRGKLAAALDGETMTAGAVASEVRAEVTAYGFEETTVAVHGVGQSAREGPRGGDTVERGQVLVVGASVTRAGDETANEDRRADVVSHVETLLLDSEVERLVSLPNTLSPTRARRERR